MLRSIDPAVRRLLACADIHFGLTPLALVDETGVKPLEKGALGLIQRKHRAANPDVVSYYRMALEALYDEVGDPCRCGLEMAAIYLKLMREQMAASMTTLIPEGGEQLEAEIRQAREGRFVFFSRGFLSERG